MSRIYNSDTHEIVFNNEISLLLFMFENYRAQTHPDYQSGDDFEEYLYDTPQYYSDDTMFSPDFYTMAEILKKYLNKYYDPEVKKAEETPPLLIF